MIGEQVEATPTEGWPVCREEHGSSLDLVERCECEREGLGNVRLSICPVPAFAHMQVSPREKPGFQ